MKRKMLIALTAGVLSAGCATNNGPLGTTNCTVHDPTMSCTGNPNDPKITLNLNTMKANPPNVCARPGQTLDISIVPPPQTSVGNVAVVPKDIADTWLIGTNSPNKLKISILIPDWVEEGTDHDYGFVTSSGKCADPRVHVM